MRYPTADAPVLRPRPYIDARQYALDAELPDQAAQPRRELPLPTLEQRRDALDMHIAKRGRVGIGGCSPADLSLWLAKAALCGELHKGSYYA